MPYRHTFQTFLVSIQDFFCDTTNFAAGIIGVIIGYFLPVKDVVNMIVVFFILDVVFGFLASHKTKKARFNVKLIWDSTIPRMLISIMIIMMAYSWDEVSKQELFSANKIIGYFISGVLFLSVIENAFILTNWGVFNKAVDATNDAIKEVNKVIDNLNENKE